MKFALSTLALVFSLQCLGSDSAEILGRNIGISNGDHCGLSISETAPDGRDNGPEYEIAYSVFNKLKENSSFRIYSHTDQDFKFKRSRKKGDALVSKTSRSGFDIFTRRFYRGKKSELKLLLDENHNITGFTYKYQASAKGKVLSRECQFN